MRTEIISIPSWLAIGKIWQTAMRRFSPHLTSLMSISFGSLAWMLAEVFLTMIAPPLNDFVSVEAEC